MRGATPQRRSGSGARALIRKRGLRVGLPGIGIAVAVGAAAIGALGPSGGGRAADAAGREGARVVQAPALPGARPISSRDRVYTADQSSNTVSVIDPARNEVLGTIRLGQDRLDQVLGPVDQTQVNVHGLGFSRDGRLLDVVSVSSNAVQLIDTATNQVRSTTYVGRAPHEAFVSPDGRELWVAVRGERQVAVIDPGRASRGAVGRIAAHIETADGPSKVVFSPDGRLAYVNHLRAAEVDVIDVRSRRVLHRVRGLAGAGSADEAISPDGRELWLGHPQAGKVTVVDARRFRVLAVLDTGPRTNHPSFVSRDGEDFAYVTVGGANETLVYRRGEGPALVERIRNSGEAPHGIWPSPDNSRVYVALQKSDAVDVIDTASNRVVETLRVGQDPQALVYVAGAVPEGSGRQGLGRQGLGRRVETRAVEVRGSAGSAKATVREVDALDEIDLTARGLPPQATFTLFAARGQELVALRAVQADATGAIEEALAFADFFGIYDGFVLAPAGQG